MVGLNISKAFIYYLSCRLIIGKIQDKNPPNHFGSTPLHWAAKNGHFEVCKLIIGEVKVRVYVMGWL